MGWRYPTTYPRSFHIWTNVLPSLPLALHNNLHFWGKQAKLKRADKCNEESPNNTALSGVFGHCTFLFKHFFCIYATIIITMSRLTWLRYPKTTSKSFKWVMIGAIIFVTSDLSIAVSTFVYPSVYWAVFINYTYLTG